MAALLLDNVGVAVAVQLRARGWDVIALSEWHGGVYLDSPDDELLRLAKLEQRLFVTFDVSTMPGLLRLLADEGFDHAGVVLISSRTFRQKDIGGIVRALDRMLLEGLPDDTTNLVRYLPPL